MASVQLPPFTYAPLPTSRHIRVLEIQQAGESTAQLHIKLAHHGFEDEDRIPYTALSYTWGAPNFIEKIVFNGSAFHVTPNLAGALRHLRMMGCLRVWVDAVCIDQKNDVEKSSQIPLMATIYREASHVIVWLGDKDEDVELMKSLRSAYRNLQSIKRDTAMPELARAIHQLVHLPWFSRRWIIQEVVLNFNVSFLCGPSELSFASLMTLVRHPIVGKETRSSVSGRSLQALWDLWEAHTMPPNENRAQQRGQDSHEAFGLVNLQSAFDHFGCFDARDRVFALMGIADNINQGQSSVFLPKSLLDERSQKFAFEFRADYTKTTEQVYTDLAIAMLRAGLIQCVFSEAITRPCADGQLHSWVPDWRVTPHPARSAKKEHSRFGGKSDICNIRPTTCGRYFILTAPMFYSAGDDRITNLMQDPSSQTPSLYIPPMKIVWSSSSTKESSWNSWVSGAIFEAWEFIVGTPSWWEGRTRNSEEYTFERQTSLWKHVVFLALFLISNKVQYGLAESRHSTAEQLCIGSREEMLQQVEELLRTDDYEMGWIRATSENWGHHRAGSFFLGIVPNLVGSYALGSTPPGPSWCSIQPRDELLALDNYLSFIIRQTATLDATSSQSFEASRDYSGSVPVYRLMETEWAALSLDGRFELSREEDLQRFKDGVRYAPFPGKGLPSTFSSVVLD